jgi:hypothetical protein
LDLLRLFYLDIIWDLGIGIWDFRPITLVVNCFHLNESATISWGYEDGSWKGPGPPLLGDADLIHKPPASIRFALIKHTLAISVEPFKYSPAEPVAYELS